MYGSVPTVTVEVRMKEIVTDERAREIVEREMGEALIQTAYAKNAPPGALVEIAGETFMVDKDGKLRGTARKPYVGTAKVDGRQTPGPKA